MTPFALLSALISLAALFSFISFRVLRLPATVGVMLLSLASSIALILAGRNAPGLDAVVSAAMGRIDFTAVVLHGMLAFLLFAGALNLDLNQLSREKLPVLILSIFGTLLSTAIVAGLLKLILYAVGLSAPLIPCLLFGALISPTDPIAVLEMLHRVGVPISLETQLAGESLFNDGIGAVLFLSLVEASSTGNLPHVGHFIALLLVKAGGGIALGLALGYAVYRLLRLVDSYRVEVLLTLALAMGGYALADALRLSAPLEVVAAGLIAGGRARRLAMSALTRDHVNNFWEVVDDILNVLLFLLMGLELLVLSLNRSFFYAGLLAIPAVLLARFVSVGASFGVLRIVRRPVRGTIAILTWGGLRGGLAIALALAIPPGPQRSELLAITYIVVVFSIMVQGLSMEKLLKHFHATAPARSV